MRADSAFIGAGGGLTKKAMTELLTRRRPATDAENAAPKADPETEAPNTDAETAGPNADAKTAAPNAAAKTGAPNTDAEAPSHLPTRRRAGEDGTPRQRRLLERPPHPDRYAPERRPAPAAPRARDGAGALARSWLRAHAASLPIVLGLLALTTILVGTGISHYPTFADDEGTYVAEAWSAVAHGQLSHYTYWYDHPPLGWIQLAVLTSIFGGLVKGATAVATARSLMLLPALATTGLLYVLGRRIGVRRRFAALAVLLLVCSPLGLTSLREVYLENFALPWLLGAFVLAASPSRRLWAFAASGACFAVAVLSKETMLLFAPGLVLALVHTVDRRTRAFCLTAFFSAFVLIAVGYPLYALLKGELLPGPGHVSLEQAAIWQLGGRQASGSVLSAHSAARSVIASWTAVDPWLLGLGVAAVPAALFLRRLRPVAVAMAVALLVAAHGGYLPEPFDIGLLPFCALLIGGLLDALWGHRILPPRGRAWLRPIGVLAVLAVLAVVLIPAWSRGDSYAMGANGTRPEVAAEHWIEKHIPRRARLLIDDTMYVDLVNRGFAPRYGVVWFYKLGFTNNLDPALVRHLPKGWREFDYVVSTPVIRSALTQDPGGYAQVSDALAHSQTVASFGPASGRIEIRRIVGPNTGSGNLPPAASTRTGS
ncbi:MAG TPA: glycosyltransferase family 39 protein [Solirubrobacteraceae bacterium]|nr:glycosyltransferase family 39 protein [Solirubrobacteraceae bacterium]